VVDKRDPKTNPGQYDIQDGFGKAVETKNILGPNKEYTFGVSRDQMFKIGVDDITKKGIKGLSPPGPGTYETAMSFGKMGSKISFSPRLKYDQVSLNRQKDLPGPGAYK
jgi:hypothetical protein